MKVTVYTLQTIQTATEQAGGKLIKTEYTTGDPITGNLNIIIAAAPEYETPFIIFTPYIIHRDTAYYTARRFKSLQNVPAKYRAYLTDAETERRALQRAALRPETRQALKESAARIKEEARQKAERLQRYKDTHGDMIGPILYYTEKHGPDALRQIATAEIKTAMQEATDELKTAITSAA